MKKFVAVTMVMLAGIGLHAQPGKTPVKPVPPVLKTSADSVSYVLGEIAAFHLVQQGLGDVKINSTAFMRAITDILGKKKTLIDDVAANALLNSYMVKLQTEKAKTHIEEGKKFLEKNKLRPGVITTATGLQYEVITEGTGIKPTAVDTFVVHYRGTLINGTEFDGSHKRNQPLVYPVSNVIPGWTEALLLMGVGSKYKLYIPYNLGYGIMGNGQMIPGGSTLIFELELLDVKKRAAQ